MPVKEKIRKDAFDYLPWAGIAVDPVLDPELFARLPGWRQRERLFIHKMVESRTPFSLDEVLRAGIGDNPDNTPVSLPSCLTYHSLHTREEGLVSGGVVGELQGVVTRELLFEHCTALGEGRRLISTKPLHGLYAYVWALVLVRKRLIADLPLPYFWELEEGIHVITGKKVNARVHEAQPLIKWLGRKADQLAANVI